MYHSGILCAASNYVYTQCLLLLIEATIATLDQLIGSKMSSFGLNCNCSEVRVEGCLEEDLHSATSLCPRSVIMCFLSDPDPHLCNVSTDTGITHGYVNTASKENDVSTIELPLVTSTDTLAPGIQITTDKNHEETFNITMVATITTQTAVLVGVLVCIVIVCLCRKIRKNVSKLHGNETSQKQQNDDTPEYAEISEYKLATAENVEDIYHYTKNDAYAA